MLSKTRLLFSSLCFLCSTISFAQTAGNSPYSTFGVGDIFNPGFIPNQAMGGVGVSNGNGSYVNHINPALLSRNKVTFFEAGLFMHFKTLDQGGQTQRANNGNLNYMSLAFPATRHWTTGLTLMPYSRVNYTTQNSSLIFRTITDFDRIDYTYTGTGGVTQANFTNGFDLGHGLSFGLETTFLFGVINKEYISQLRTQEVGTSYSVVFQDRTNFSDFLFKPGLAYRYKLKDRLFLNAGATYTIGSKVNAKRLTTLQHRDADGNPFTSDTTENNVQGTANIPNQYQFGLSLESFLRWTIAADFSYQKWSQFHYLNNADISGDTYSAALGGEFTPNYNSVDNYLKRVTYRIGANYSQVPVRLNGKQLDDLSVSAGASFPLARGFADMNLAFVFGQRGRFSEFPIKEQYFKIFLGFTLRDNSWFLKRKID